MALENGAGFYRVWVSYLGLNDDNGLPLWATVRVIKP